MQVTLANYEVAQIFVDARNFVNVLFKEAFHRMQLNLEKLQLVTTSLFDFVGHEVCPLGKISLPLSLREEPRQTKIVPFIVVEVRSTYNAILGKLTLAVFFNARPLDRSLLFFNVL